MLFAYVFRRESTWRRHSTSKQSSFPDSSDDETLETIPKKGATKAIPRRSDMTPRQIFEFDSRVREVTASKPRPTISERTRLGAWYSIASYRHLALAIRQNLKLRTKIQNDVEDTGAVRVGLAPYTSRDSPSCFLDVLYRIISPATH